MDGGKRILIIRLSALGDVAMTLPIIYSLAERYPMLQIDVLTRPFFADLFINRPANINIIKADYKKTRLGCIGTIKLLMQLKSRHYDCVADLHNVLRSWIIDDFFLLRGVKVAMVNKGRMSRKKILSAGYNARNFSMRYVDVFRKLGCPVTTVFKSVFEKKPARLPITVNHPAVGVAPFARYINKIYPLDKMRDVVRLLLSAGMNVYMFGAKGAEKAILEQWALDEDNCVSLAGRYTIDSEIAIMSELDIMISMDSANQHLAAVAGTKAITIWGSTTPACGFAAYNQSSECQVCLNTDCQPCTIAGSNKCRCEKELSCLSGISPECIIDVVKQQLSHTL